MRILNPLSNTVLAVLPKSFPALLIALGSAFQLASADPGRNQNLPAGQENEIVENQDDWTGLKAAGWALGGSLLPMALGTALLLSPEDAAVPGLVLLTAGIIAGPSMGQYYAGSPIQATAGLAIRGLAFGVAVAGVNRALAAGSCAHLKRMGDNEQCDSESNGAAFFTLGSFVLAGGAMYSFIDTYFAVVRKRERTRTEAAQFGLAPTLALAGEGRSRYGAHAWLRF